MDSFRKFRKIDETFKSGPDSSLTSRTNFISQTSSSGQNVRSSNRQDYFPQGRLQVNANFAPFNRGSNFLWREGYKPDYGVGNNSQSRQNMVSGIKRNYPSQETHDYRSSQIFDYQNSRDNSFLSQNDSFNEGRTNTNHQLRQDYEAPSGQDNDSQSKTRNALQSRFECESGSWRQYKEPQSKLEYGSQSRQDYSSQRKLEYGVQSRHDYSSQSKLEYGSQSRQDYSSQSKLEYGSQSRQDYSSQSKLEYGSQSRQDYSSQSKLEYGSQSRPNYSSLSKLEYGSQSRQGYSSQSRQDYFSNKQDYLSPSELRPKWQDSSPQNMAELGPSKGQDFMFERRQEFCRPDGTVQNRTQHYDNPSQQDLRSLGEKNYGYERQYFRSQRMQNSSPQNETELGPSKGQDFCYERRQDFSRRDDSSHSGRKRELQQNYGYQSQQDSRSQSVQDYQMRKVDDDVSKQQGDGLSRNQNFSYNQKELSSERTQHPSTLVDIEPPAKIFKGEDKTEDACGKVEENEDQTAGASPKDDMKKLPPALRNQQYSTSDFFCDLCRKRLKLFDNHSYYNHCQGRKHKTRLHDAGKLIPPLKAYIKVFEETPPVGEEYVIEGISSLVKCTLCDLVMSEKNRVMHCKGRQHKVVYLMKHKGKRIPDNPEKSGLNPEDPSQEIVLKGDEDKECGNSDDKSDVNEVYESEELYDHNKYRLKGEDLICPLCNIMIKNDTEYLLHLKGENHKQRLEDYKQEGRDIPNCSLTIALEKAPPIGLEFVVQVEGTVQVSTSEDSTRYRCKLCNCQMLLKFVINHCKANRHRNAYSKFRQIRMRHLEAESTPNNSGSNAIDSNGKKVVTKEGEDSINACKVEKVQNENDENKVNEPSCGEVVKDNNTDTVNDVSHEEGLEMDEDCEDLAEDVSHEDLNESVKSTTDEPQIGSSNSLPSKVLEECENIGIPIDDNYDELSDAELVKEKALIKEKEEKLSLGDPCCPLCNLTIRSDFAYRTHCRGKKHKALKRNHTNLGLPIPNCSLSQAKMLANKNRPPVGEEYLKENEVIDEINGPTFKCTLCFDPPIITSKQVISHCKSAKHRCFYSSKLKKLRKRIDDLLYKNNRRLDNNAPLNEAVPNKDDEGTANETQEISELKKSGTDNSPPTERPIYKRCEICNIDCPDEFSYSTHLRGGRHRKELAYQRIFHNKKISRAELKKSKQEAVRNILPIGEEFIEIIPSTERRKSGKLKPPMLHCKLCDSKFDKTAQMSHLKGMRHRVTYKEKVDPNFLVVDMHDRGVPWKQFVIERRKAEIKEEQDNREKLQENFMLFKQSLESNESTVPPVNKEN